MKRFFIFLFALTALVFAGCGGGGGSSSGGTGGGGGGGGEGKQCSLSFYDGNGAEYADLKNTVNCGTEITLSKDKTREGYTLQGWLLSGTDELLTDKYTVNSDTVFNAKWKSNNPNITEYIVYFYDDSSPIPELTKTVQRNSWIFLPPLEKDGYIFSGWEVESTVYRAKAPYKAISNTTFTAVWKLRNPEEYAVVLYDDKLDYKETLTLPGAIDVISSLPSVGWYREGGTLPISTLNLDKDITLYGLPNVHEVSDETELDAVRNYPSHNYILVDNIELTDTTLDIKGWRPIGDSATNAFSGIFNGNGYRITGLFINITSTSKETYAGLFGSLTGKVKNLGVELTGNGINVTSNSTDSSSNSYVGGIAGYVDSIVTIENCYFIGDINFSSYSSDDSDSYVGGIAGYSSNSYYYGRVEIENCYFMGDITSSSSSYGSSSSSSHANSYVGGIMGYDSDTIKNCYFIGNITSSSIASFSASYAGGIVGYGSDTIDNCYFIGNINSSSSASASDPYTLTSSDALAGGIVGGSGTVKNSYSIGNITSTSHSYSSHSIAGGIAGRGGIIDDSYSIGKITAASTTSAIVGPESYSHAGGIAGNGSGSTIKNSHSVGDISAVSTSPEAMTTAALAGGIVGYGYGSTSTIENCYSIGDINSSSYNYMSYAGGIAGGVYGGLAIKNCYSIGNITAAGASSPYLSSDATAGGIAGQGYTIENCYSIGNITATVTATETDTSSMVVAGGIMGYGDTIINSYSIGDITATADSTDSEAFAGGIAGQGYTIENSYSIGNITATATATDADATAGVAAGGIAGYGGDIIKNSYSIGDITAAADPTDSEVYAGGVAGYGDSYGTIENCAALSENLISVGAKGRIVGDAFGSALTNNFANSGMLLNGYPVTGTSGDENGADKGLSLFEDQELYETDLGWEFGNNGDALIWKMPSVGTGYPILYWQP